LQAVVVAARVAVVEAVAVAPVAIYLVILVLLLVTYLLLLLAVAVLADPHQLVYRVQIRQYQEVQFLPLHRQEGEGAAHMNHEMAAMAALVAVELPARTVLVLLALLHPPLFKVETAELPYQ
jgi:hypothetical protein